MPDPSPFLSHREAVCPPDLLARAQACPSPRVAIAAAASALPMQAAKEATEAGIMEPVFTGNADTIRAHAEALEWDISGLRIVEAEGEAGCGKAAAELCGAGEADVLMKGQLHTDQFMKAALNREAGLRGDRRLVHLFHISHPDGGRPLIVSDAAVNVEPDIETRKAAAVDAVQILKTLGNPEPRVAFLSATESVIDSVPSSVSARELRDWARATIPGAHFAGPLALDLAISPDSARVKGMADDPVAGYADALIVPDIISGNALFKSLVYLSGGCAAGIVLGAKVPLLLTSRADPAAARLASASLAAIMMAASA